MREPTLRVPSRIMDRDAMAAVSDRYSEIDAELQRLVPGWGTPNAEPAPGASIEQVAEVLNSRQDAEAQMFRILFGHDE